jgi:hypothetical protein
MTDRLAPLYSAPGGYSTLLNLERQRHWTIFLSDFDLSAVETRRLRRHLETVATKPQFIRIDRGVDEVIQKLRGAGVDLRNDYLSMQALVVHHRHLRLLHHLFDTIPHRDLARVDLPLAECGFRRSFATHLLDVVMRADYREQEAIANRFFSLLSRQNPYQVTVETAGLIVEIYDRRPWFDLGGKLHEGEWRILPGGELAYTGAKIDGHFVADGAILPVPEHPSVAHDARRIAPLSRELTHYPLQLEIRAGRVVALSGAGTAPTLISKLLERHERYREVTEVGISFNRASNTFIYDWAASSNEARPGVHLGIGGDPSPDDDTEAQRDHLVHIDFMAANCSVYVNRQPFLRTSS